MVNQSNLKILVWSCTISCAKFGGAEIPIRLSSWHFPIVYMPEILSHVTGYVIKLNTTTQLRPIFFSFLSLLFFPHFFLLQQLFLSFIIVNGTSLQLCLIVRPKNSEAKRLRELSLQQIITPSTNSGQLEGILICCRTT